MRSWKTTSLSAAGWRRDDQNRLILLRIPPQINPTPPDSDKGHSNKSTETIAFPARKQSPSIITLPPEIIHEIASHLHPVDRVCLALTCKSLLFSVLSAPRLCPTTWSRFSDRRYDWLLPESYSLILRLAHGWIPKDKLRYCWKCHKILPRDEGYFRKRLCGKKTPKYSVKIGLSKERWNDLSKKEKYNHLIETWCYSDAEDSSCLYCDHCRDKCLESAATSHLQHPVQCPLCLEKELTYVWRPPRKPWVRKTLCKCLKILWAPIELIACYFLMCCVFVVRMVYDQARRCWRALCH